MEVVEVEWKYVKEEEEDMKEQQQRIGNTMVHLGNTNILPHRTLAFYFCLSTPLSIGLDVSLVTHSHASCDNHVGYCSDWALRQRIDRQVEDLPHAQGSDRVVTNKNNNACCLPILRKN